MSNIIFYYKRFSARNTKSMKRFRIQLLIKDNTWSTQYTIPENDQIETPHAYMCFSNNTIRHSIY